MLKTYQQYDPTIMLQENLDANEERFKWIKETKYKLQNLKHQPNEPAIPHKSHVIYVTNNLFPNPIKLIAINKTIETANQLNTVNSSYKHYFWTNNVNIIPIKIKNIKNLEIHLINEFKEHSLWDSLEKILDKSQSEPGFFVQAGDILRLMVVQKHGGIYHDLDYSLYNAKELIKITNEFNFVNARELDQDNSYIGNAFIAASPNNLIINAAITFCNRNLNLQQHKNTPTYIKFPLNGADKILFETGPVMLSIAYYSSIEQSRNAGYTDIILPPKMLYNFEYSRSTTPEYIDHSNSYIKNQKNSTEMQLLIHDFFGITINTLGGDMFSGSWAANLLTPIDYGEESFNTSSQHLPGEVYLTVI